MSLAYNQTFAMNVIAGYLLTLLGAVLGLAAVVWWTWTGEGAQGGSRPQAFRALSTLAFVLFVVGLFWQLAGYLRLNYAGAW
jgi:hypothetical protein